MAGKISEFARLVVEIAALGGAGEIDELYGLAAALSYPWARRRWWRVEGAPLMIGA